MLFSPYLAELQLTLKKAARTNNLSESVYRSAARNILFRLEALARIGRGIVDKKNYDELYTRFKQLEDVLGSIDYAEGMEKAFTGFGPLAANAKKHFGRQYREGIAQLGLLLTEDGWTNGQAFATIEKSTSSFPDLSETKWRKKLGEFLAEEIEKTESKYRNGELNPHDIEGGLHEFRRRIRWFSIYAAALNGLVKLRKVPVTDTRLKVYCTKEIVNSPFNKLPATPRGVQPFMIQSTYFYALSYVINETGRLKDAALTAEACKVLQKEYPDNSSKTSEAAKRFTAKLPWPREEIPVRAENMIDEFIYRDQVLMRIARDVRRSEL